MKPGLTVDELKLAKASAQRKIAAAIITAMQDYNTATGEFIVSVDCTILSHTSCGTLDETMLQSVDVETSARSAV